uniref:NADH-ubiquinone oxidoreductase chain 2 n=1 Tax=Scolytinae sp. BMNH 1274712 TaxID=1796543 RepID=A0A140EG32_9CUCU|nr:NADH dehydrogenase subunit 2 [Scolytinae sp. BMNH 1274712]
MKLNQLLFLSVVISSSLISISSMSWMGVWFGLEINLVAFIPLINYDKNSLKTEASIKYFISQALASSILLFSIILLNENLMNPYNWLILSTSLMIKMGTAPFHFWFPQVMESLNWPTAYLLMTWQKIAPLSIISYITPQFKFLILIIIMNMLISSIMGLNQTSLRKIMAFSSINHIGWMLSTMITSNMVWVYYFIIYSLINLNLMFMFNLYKLFHFNQIISLKTNIHLKLFFIMNFMSIAGLPPFLGFIPKWLTIQYMVNFNLTLIIFMIIMTLIPSYFYIRLSLSTMMINSNNNSLKMNNNNLFFITTSNMMTIMGMILLTLMFNFF